MTISLSWAATKDHMLWFNSYEILEKVNDGGKKQMSGC